MILLFIFLFQFGLDIPKEIWIVLISSGATIFFGLIGLYWKRGKDEADLHKTKSETEQIQAATISALRKDVADAQNQKLEFLEKLDVWIERYENSKEDRDESDNKRIEVERHLGEALERLDECLDDKDEKCKKCLRKVIRLFDKFERSLIGSVPHQDLLVEISVLRKELEGDEHD